MPLSPLELQVPSRLLDIPSDPTSTSSSSSPTLPPSPKYSHNGAHIDWSIPTPRKGIWGAIDSTAGPGFTFWEGMVPLIACVLAIVFVVFILAPQHPEWTTGQVVAVAMFALNVGFGTAVSTNALKRWYHRSGAGISGLDLFFVFIDGLGQTAVANYMFLDQLNGEWLFLASVGSYLFLSFALFNQVPAYLKRPTNIASLMILVFLATYAFPQIPGMEWYPYVIFIKYLNHLVREEPVRPAPIC